MRFLTADADSLCAHTHSLALFYIALRKVFLNVCNYAPNVQINYGVVLFLVGAGKA